MIFMKDLELKQIQFNRLAMQVPVAWNVNTETYLEPDGRECSMIEISAAEGDPRSIIISYGPMPEGSDALMEAGGTYEDIIGEIGPSEEEDPICEYDFLGTTAYGFEVPTEDNLACNFICVEIGSPTQVETGTECKLLTVLTTAKTYEDIDDLLDLVEEHISLA